MNWQDLRVALAVSRAGSRAGAARALGVDETTVARRLAALEAALGAALFLKGARGQVVATALGETVLAHAARIEVEVLAISGARESVGPAVVRVTAVPAVINRILVPRLAAFMTAHPGITVELIPEARNLDLTKREADLALRLAKPVTGGRHVLTRRLGALEFAVFGPAAGGEALPWIGYEAGSQHLPQAQWQQGQEAALRVADLETAVEAVAAGLGQAMLPVAVADARLALVARSDFSRDVWMLAHADQRHLPGVTAVVDWLAGLDWAGPSRGNTSR